MQTILGSNGQIGQELAKELFKKYTKDIRLVSRKPRKVNSTDHLFPEDLLKFEEASAAIAGSEIVYFTAGLPMNSELWEEQFPLMMKNVIEACKLHQSKLVFFDNTYMYPKNSEVQYEDTKFVPKGRKSAVRAHLAEMVIKEMENHALEAVICRAPEFYGPNHTQSITNTMVFNAIKENKKIKIPLSATRLRTLIWTPDASRAMALIGNDVDAYSQTWHLPCAPSLTYQDIITLSEKITGQKLRYTTIKMWQFKLASLFSQKAKELQELLPRYAEDNVFNSDKFKKRFPEFEITSFEAGIKAILSEK
ncbi:NAD-dependent epimerase/dehydratase family protein [Lactococcus formosensis]|uniref:NAD-dependent epimerase/dehydratase family protein n=1 Tax=Lactococcus formosensis TaxID=1281486 RepID=UPI002097670E|nr:NAD-dependent epimerase/dehydratase family protein [Lactococcus formosensis]MCO7179678.1 NAD-dependent epimerase/dehydratase family protein [Lactococcus formosensis]